MLEEERKYDVDPRYTMPDLGWSRPKGGRLLPRSPASLRATYYDTPDLRLARAGISLRHRRGDEQPWTVKLPTEAVGVRREISRPGPAGELPDEFVRLLTAYHRGASLNPVVTIRTVRRAYEVRDAADRMLVEIADDTVTVLDGREQQATFREIEVERRHGDAALVRRIGKALRAAGATEGGFTAKHVRAIGPAAAAHPDLAPVARSLPRRPTAALVVAEAIRRHVNQIFAYDPLVRLGEPLPDGDTAVHQMRVACRRLRSDLRTFAPLLDGAWADELRAELSWLADALGVARDAEVLRDRLHRTAALDPLTPLDPAAVARIDAGLAARHDDALWALDEALGSPRYLALLERLIAAAATPPTTAEAEGDAREVLPALVRRPWRRLRKAARLDPQGPDEVWHAARIRGKRARYAADAVAPVLGGGAAAMAKALGRVQTLLGDHQDAAVAGHTWLEAAEADPEDQVLAITVGRLYERERAAVRAARERFPAVWAAAKRHNRTGWLDT